MGDVVFQAFSDHIPTAHVGGIIAKLDGEENTATVSYFCRTAAKYCHQCYITN